MVITVVVFIFFVTSVCVLILETVVVLGTTVVMMVVVYTFLVTEPSKLAVSSVVSLSVCVITGVPSVMVVVSSLSA